MRVSDTERQRAIDELRRHCAAGRIDVDEYARRIEQALVAATLEDLDRVRGDLPMLRIADPAGSASAANGKRRFAFDGLATTDDLAARRLARKVSATAVASITVAVLVVAVLVAVVASWPWAVALVAGWVAGMVQGRLSARRR